MFHNLAMVEIEAKFAETVLNAIRSDGQTLLLTVVAFFCVAYAFTWILHGLIVLLNLPFERQPASKALVLYFLGLGGPLIAALLLTYLSYGQAAVIDLLSSAVIWQFSPVWYVLAIAPVGIIYLVSAVVYRLWRKVQSVLFKMPPKGFLLILVAQLWIAIAEEFGWRGFALPHLQDLIGWLGGGFILGILWASWHLPMFFVHGSNQYGSSFPRYMYVLTVWSLFMAMLFYQSGGSVLLCMIFHAAANLWGFTVNVPEHGEKYVPLLYLPMLLAAIALLSV